MQPKSRKDKKIQRELRRSRAELASLKSYLRDCEEIKVEYSSEWLAILSSLNSFFDKKEDKKIEEKSVSTYHHDYSKEEHERGNNILEKEKSDIPDWVKKAFRKIAMKTHPDKIDKLPNKEELASLYTKANALIDEARFSEIVDICYTLGVEVELEPEAQLSSNLDNIEKIKNKISILEKSPEWIWGETEEVPHVRVTFLLSLLPQLGYLETTKEKVEDFIKNLNL